MYTFKAVNGNQFMQGFLLDLKDQIEELQCSHQALFALAQMVDVAGNGNAVAAPHLATLIQMLGESMASRTAQLTAHIAAQQNVLFAAKGAAAHTAKGEA